MRRSLPVEPALPKELQVEVTGACNLRCHMCLVRYRPPIDRVHGSLSFDDLVAIVDAVPDLERLTLQGLGEPLLVPELVRMVRYAAKRGVDVGFNTNGTLLSEARGRELIEAGLGWLCISIDGATAATFEAIRDGARFDRVVTNTRTFASLRRRLGADSLDLAITFVAMRSNIAELPDLIALAGELGVPRVRVQNLSHGFDDCDPAGEYAEIRDFADREALWEDADLADTRASFAEAASVAAVMGVELRLPGLEEAPPTGCDWPWTGAYITHDRQVQPCCMVMGSDRVALGDLSSTSFPVIWRDRAYRDFREGLAAGSAHDVCQGCSAYRGVF